MRQVESTHDSPTRGASTPPKVRGEVGRARLPQNVCTGWRLNWSGAAILYFAGTFTDQCPERVQCRLGLQGTIAALARRPTRTDLCSTPIPLFIADPRGFLALNSYHGQ